MMRETILDRILSIDHRQAGLHLGQDEDFVYLIFRGKPVRAFPGATVRIAEIHEEANKYLKQDAIVDAVKVSAISIEKLDFLNTDGCKSIMNEAYDIYAHNQQFGTYLNTMINLAFAKGYKLGKEEANADRKS